MGLPGQSAQRAHRLRRPFRSRWPSPSACCCCAANPPTCCRWARSTSAWSSMPPSSWWRTSFADLSQPPSQRFQRSAIGARGAGSDRAARQIRGDRQRGDRGEQEHLLLRRDHHRRLRAAVHHERHRGPHLRADGQDLCLCHRRRPDRHLHRHAGAVRACSCSDQESEKDTWLVRADAQSLPAGRALRAGQPDPDPGHAGRCCWSSPASPCARSGLEFLPKLEEGNLWIRATMPTSISLDGGDGHVNRMRNDHEELSGSGHRRLPAWPAG